MTISHPNLQRLDEKLYYIPNFISKEEVDYINKLLKEREDKSTRHPFGELNYGVTGSLVELFPVWEKVSELLSPQYVVHPLLSMLHYKEGASMEPHWDSPGEGHHEDLTLPDVWSTCCILEFGVCVYFGEFTGGEVFYPKQDILLAVQPGDLVIHGALEDYAHGVKPVLSGSRYTYSNFCLEAVKNPGTFYNYGTEEYKLQTMDRSRIEETWLDPLVLNDQIVILPEEMTEREKLPYIS